MATHNLGDYSIRETENGFELVEKDTGEGADLENLKSLSTEDIENTREVTINGETVDISHRNIASTLPPEDIEVSGEIELRPGDIYRQIDEGGT